MMSTKNSPSSDITKPPPTPPNLCTVATATLSNPTPYLHYHPSYLRYPRYQLPFYNFSLPSLTQHHDTFEDSHCKHDPQYVLWISHFPPHGPPTQEQFELQFIVMNNETERK